MESKPKQEFGKRRPAVARAAARTTAAHPVKRSRHVALLLMGPLAIGGGAFAVMPGERCEPKGAGMAAPSLPQSGAECPPRGSSGGHGGSGGSAARSNFYGGDTSSSRASGTSAQSGSGEATRGGFGGFARAFAAHFSGGS
jgi:hypothetical protein